METIPTVRPTGQIRPPKRRPSRCPRQQTEPSQPHQSSGAKLLCVGQLGGGGGKPIAAGNCRGLPSPRLAAGRCPAREPNQCQRLRCRRSSRSTRPPHRALHRCCYRRRWQQLRRSLRCPAQSSRTRRPRPDHARRTEPRTTSPELCDRRCHNIGLGPRVSGIQDAVADQQVRACAIGRRHLGTPMSGRLSAVATMWQAGLGSTGHHEAKCRALPE